MVRAKKNNISQILHLVNQMGSISKKDIAAELGLTPAALTLICGDLLEKGILVETGEREGGKSHVGRKKVLLDIDPEYGYVVGINIDSANTVIAICDIKGKLREKKVLRTEKEMGPEEFLQYVAREALELSERLEIPKDRLLGIGVGVPGVVDKKQGISIRAYGVWGEPVEVRHILENVTGLEVLVENNVNAFATAEILFGNGREYNDFFLIKWGPGVGSAIICGGNLYETENARAAEFGHVIVDPGGSKCVCGKCGCLETIVSAKALSGKNKEETDEAIKKFALMAVNAETLLQPQSIVLYGDLFSRDALCDKFCEYVAAFEPERTIQMIRSDLTSEESYIGPVAYFIDQKVYA
jgi:predicted NBD/HSP70 family sugar kinase